MLKEFKEFVSRGNLVDLAVAFIMGVAFTAVVTAFTDVVLGTISFVVGGEVSFEQLGVHRDGEIVIPYGAFLTALVNLLLVALALFFVVKAYNRFSRRRDETPSTRPCPFCTTTISRDATRCPGCTSQVEPAPA
ncbi:MAG TPA: large conductance mechanosensitive channel protein MscL [Actinomycetota bacterium]|nr:large conductance mechanosensitive channel protein MscL [Actinomycetota bacterium]